MNKIFTLSSLFFILILILVFFSIKFGTETISIFNKPNSIILQFRLNKALTSILAGICLPIAGFLLQELFKNPLAGPSVLGISSSASLGVAVVVFLGNTLFYIENYSQWILVFAALVGAFICVILLFSVSTKMKDKNTFIIIGFLISALAGAIISFLEYISPSDVIKQYLIWSLGSFSGLSIEKIYLYSIFTLVGLFFSLFSVQMLRGNLLGEIYARSLGVNLKLMNFYILLSSSILTGVTTAFLGPIAFIGIIIPYFCRLLISPAQLWKQFILNILVGVFFMLIINILSDFILLPINIITSLIGIPILLYIMLKK